MSHSFSSFLEALRYEALPPAIATLLSEATDADSGAGVDAGAIGGERGGGGGSGADASTGTGTGTGTGVHTSKGGGKGGVSGSGVSTSTGGIAGSGTGNNGGGGIADRPPPPDAFSSLASLEASLKTSLALVPVRAAPGLALVSGPSPGANPVSASNVTMSGLGPGSGSGLGLGPGLGAGSGFGSRSELASGSGLGLGVGLGVGLSRLVVSDARSLSMSSDTAR